jgi:hypothetical protein
MSGQAAARRTGDLADQSEARRSGGDPLLGAHQRQANVARGTLQHRSAAPNDAAVGVGSKNVAVSEQMTMSRALTVLPAAGARTPGSRRPRASSLAVAEEMRIVLVQMFNSNHLPS